MTVTDKDHVSMSELKADINKLKADLADVVAGATQSAKLRAEHGVGVMNAKASAAQEKTVETVREHPMTSLAAAFLAGAAAAALLSRRS